MSFVGFGFVFHSNFHLNAFSNLIYRSKTSIRLELVYVVIYDIGHFGRSNRMIKTAMVKNRMKMKMKTKYAYEWIRLGPGWKEEQCVGTSSQQQPTDASRDTRKNNDHSNHTEVYVN